MSRSVLVCTDFSAAAAAGEREAVRRFPDARLVLFHALDPRLRRRFATVTKEDEGRIGEEMRNYADTRLEEVVRRLIAQGADVTPELVEGDPVDSALAAAARHDAELVVVGVERGVEIGRFRTRLARRAGVPVLLVPEAGT